MEKNGREYRITDIKIAKYNIFIYKPTHFDIKEMIKYAKIK